VIGLLVDAPYALLQLNSQMLLIISNNQLRFWHLG